MPVTNIEEERAEIRVERDGDAFNIAGSGALDFMNSGHLRGELERAANESDTVVMDFREAYFIDTAILEYLAHAAKILRLRDKRLTVIVRKGSHPERVLFLSCFNQLMDIEVDAETADSVE